MSPAQQRGLALWAALLSTVVCLGFLSVTRLVSVLVLLTVLGLIMACWYVASRRARHDVTLQLDNHTVPENESLSLTLTGTNGQLPRRALQSTVLDTVMKSTSASVAVRNLCAPTLPCYPPAQDRFHWRVLSHLGSGFLSMMDNADVLRGTLALYEWTDSEMNRRRLEAIIDVKHSETGRFEQGYLVRGVQIEVTLDSHGFAGRGDICLFGEMLSRFFALYTDIYLFNRLIIILQPTGERLEWEEKHNRRIPG